MTETLSAAKVHDDRRTNAILESVIQAFLSGGYEAVVLRSIAREARVSLATIYEIFPSRQELCAAAMHRWVAQQYFGPLPQLPPGSTRGERVMAVVENLLGPFLREPHMLSVLAQTREGAPGAGADTLNEQALAQVQAAWASLSTGPDDQVSRTEMMIIYHLLCSLVVHFRDGAITADRILVHLDRFVRRLMDESPGV